MAERVKEALLASIANGNFGDGRLPSEERIAVELGVSRTTVREALRSLEEEGLISRQRGIGTRVNSHVVRATSLNRIVGFYDLIREAGYEPTIKRTEIHHAAADPDTELRLRGGKGGSLLLIERLFLADADPVIHLVEKVPANEVERPFEASDVPDSIFAFAEAFCRSPVDHTVVEIVPTVADDQVVKHLRLAAGEPLLRLIETHYSPDGRPFIVSLIHVVDRLLRFTVVRKRT